MVALKDRISSRKPDYENPAGMLTAIIFMRLSITRRQMETKTSSAHGFTVTVSDAIEGRIVDGPLRNGKVFLDLNGNSRQDFGEPSGSTDENGFFTISYVQSAKDAVLANLYTARVIAVGGQDTFTEQELPDFSVISDLPLDTTQFVYVTPITTVVAAAKTIAAKAQVLISLDIDLTFQTLLTTPYGSKPRKVTRPPKTFSGRACKSPWYCNLKHKSMV